MRDAQPVDPDTVYDACMTADYERIVRPAEHAQEIAKLQVEVQTVNAKKRTSSVTFGRKKQRRQRRRTKRRMSDRNSKNERCLRIESRTCDGSNEGSDSDISPMT
jgi:hypothetical protein